MFHLKQGYCHYVSGAQRNSLFHHLINFSVQNSPHFADVFGCQARPNATGLESGTCSLF